jgi:CRISPR-associated protein Cas2
MSDFHSRYVICYDITNDKRRDKIAALLLDHGVRVQYSVFEVVVDKMLFDSLINKMKRIIKKSEEDMILAYPLCANCDHKTLRLGAQSKEPHGTEVVFIV